MPQQPSWRVRVKRSIEDWVSVQADTAMQAETEAYKVPGVVSVFGKSAIPGDKPMDVERPLGVHEEE